MNQLMGITCEKMSRLFELYWICIALINGIDSLSIPDSFDWISKGVITPVNSYRETSYSAAVVIVETIESLHAIATGERIRGSVARVIDCCHQTGFTYDCVQQLGGICTYDAYPEPRGVCEGNACVPFASFDTLNDYSGLNETSLIAAMPAATLMISIDATPRTFLEYSGGIYQETNCSQTEVNHALQLIGYGNAVSGEQYWLAKNNWGPDWGEQGFIRILLGANICGLTRKVYQPRTNPRPETSLPTTANTTTTVQTTESSSTTAAPSTLSSSMTKTPTTMTSTLISSTIGVTTTTASGTIKVSWPWFIYLSIVTFGFVLI